MEIPSAKWQCAFYNIIAQYIVLPPVHKFLHLKENKKTKNITEYNTNASTRLIT